jgi:hypothetical protein
MVDDESQEGVLRHLVEAAKGALAGAQMAV